VAGSVDRIRGVTQGPAPRARKGGGAAHTSTVAYREAILSGGKRTQRDRIVETLKASGVPLTRRQISGITRISINATCSAVFSLLRDGLLCVAYEDEDLGTRTKAQFLEVTSPAPVQRIFAWPKMGGEPR